MSLLISSGEVASCASPSARPPYNISKRIICVSSKERRVHDDDVMRHYYVP